MKKLLFMLMGVAATINVMAVEYTAKATLVLESNTSHLTCEIDLVQADEYGVLDGYDMYMPGRKVALYPICGDRQLQIATAADFTNVRLGLLTDASTEYTITISGVEGAQTLVLYDLADMSNIKQYPLTEGTINITAAANSTIEDRFVINYVPAPEFGSYERIVTNGNFGTICLPKNGEITGATLFDIASFENEMIYIDEVNSTAMEAGKPYIFQATADQIKVIYSDGNEVTAGEANGLHGYFDANNYFEVPADNGNYILNSNQYWLVVSARQAYLNNYFAYIKIAEINNQAPAPGRRRIGMAVNGEQVATGIDEVNATEAPVKKVIDGKMVIIRGEHMFDATGRMVK